MKLIATFIPLRYVECITKTVIKVWRQYIRCSTEMTDLMNRLTFRKYYKKMQRR